MASAGSASKRRSRQHPREKSRRALALAVTMVSVIVSVALQLSHVFDYNRFYIFGCPILAVQTGCIIVFDRVVDLL